MERWFIAPSSARFLLMVDLIYYLLNLVLRQKRLSLPFLNFLQARAYERYLSRVSLTSLLVPPNFILLWISIALLHNRFIVLSRIA